jgi:hypothetical protein
MSNNITLIIEAEANKHVNEYMLKGFSEIESFRFALDKIKSLRKQEALVVIHWEIEKALIVKIANYESNK